MGLILEEYYEHYRSDRTNLLLRRLYLNIECCKLYSTRYLLDHADIALSGDSGRFALYLAAKISRKRSKARNIIFKWILEFGCNILNHIDGSGLDVLLWLLSANQITFVKILLKYYKMDINLRHTDRDNNNALMYAIWTKNNEIVSLISDIYIQFGLNLDVRNRNGFTPYAEAVKLKLDDITGVLKRTGKISQYASASPYESIVETKDLTVGFSQMRINLCKVGMNVSSSSELVERDISSKTYFSSQNGDRSLDIGYHRIPPDPTPAKDEQLNVNRTKSYPKVSPCMKREVISRHASGNMDDFKKSVERKALHNKSDDVDSSDESNDRRQESCLKKVHFDDKREGLDGRISRAASYGSIKTKSIGKSDKPAASLAILQDKSNNGNKCVSYSDLREMLPQEIGAYLNKKSKEEIRWLLALQAEQNSDAFVKKRKSLTTAAEPDKLLSRKREKRKSISHRSKSDISFDRVAAHF